MVPVPLSASLAAVLVPLLLVNGYLGGYGNGDHSGSQDSGHGISYTEKRDPCAEFNPYRNLYFGDLRVHTGLSHETWILDVPPAPGEAYRFAKGEPIRLPPLDEHGVGTRTVQLDTPLDFAAVTDHGEFLAEVEACTTQESGAYDSPTCTLYRQKSFLSEVVNKDCRITPLNPGMGKFNIHVEVCTVVAMKKCLRSEQA